jgi:hypothetical protein
VRKHLFTSSRVSLFPGARAVEMVVDHFWNPNYSVIFENINPDYTFDLDSYDGRHIIPGHGLESCWFMLQYAEKNKRPELIPKICEEIKGLLDFSWDPARDKFEKILSKTCVLIYDLTMFSILTDRTRNTELLKIRGGISHIVL